MGSIRPPNPSDSDNPYKPSSCLAIKDARKGGVTLAEGIDLKTSMVGSTFSDAYSQVYRIVDAEVGRHCAVMHTTPINAVETRKEGIISPEGKARRAECYPVGHIPKADHTFLAERGGADLRCSGETRKLHQQSTSAWACACAR